MVRAALLLQFEMLSRLVGLVLLHISSLWEDSRRIRILLWSTLVFSTCGSLAVLAVGIQRAYCTPFRLIVSGDHTNYHR